MKIVSTKLAGDRSLVDHVWNDAMETAAPVGGECRSRNIAKGLLT